MYAMPKSCGTIIRKSSVKAFSRELNKHRIISSEFAEDCRKMRTNISPAAMDEMDKLFRELRK